MGTGRKASPVNDPVTMSIRAIIIDDEEGARESLHNILTRYFSDVEVVAKAANINDGEKYIHEQHPDLVFLDIEMPFGNAFDLLERFEDFDFDIIFITAYDQYAIQAIKFSALDYLLKPIDPDDLGNALDRYRQRAKQKSSLGNEAYNALMQNLQSEQKVPTRVGIPESDGVRFVSIADIVRCESDGNYTYLHLADKTRILSSKTLGDYEELFKANNFYRIHRSHLVNMVHIQKYVKGEGGYLRMSDGSEVEVARRKKNEFLEVLGQL